MLTDVKIKPHVFKIIHNNQIIGLWNDKRDGAFIGFPKELYHKLNAYGIIKELMDSSKYYFNTIYFSFEGKIYYSSRVNFLKEGILEKTKFGIKIFLSLNKWEIKRDSDTQLKIDFPEGDTDE